jgi:type I restriction enzyme S subunit
MNDDIPEGWRECTLEKVGEIVTGNTPPRNALANYGDEYSWVKPPDLGSDRPITNTAERLSKKGAAIARLVPSGTTLVSCIGLLGKIGFAGRTLATNQQINSVVFDPQLVEPRYGFHYCKTLRPWMEANSSSTTVAIINKGRFSQAPFHLAPLAEQRRIVAKLEKLLGQIDTCQRRLARIPALLKRFRQSVLAAACSGRLTADWRNRNPSGSTQAEELPDGWRLLELKEAADTIDPNPSHRYPSYEGGSVPILATEQMRGLNEWSIANSKLVNSTFHAERSAAHGFRVDDIIFARKGRLGLARRPPQIPQFVFSHTVFIIRTLRGISSDYLLWYLRRDECVTWLLREMNSNTGVPTLGKGYMERLPVALPPLSEQLEIVRRVENLFALADRVEARFAEGQERVDSITQAILAKAFRGELVPTEAELASREGRAYESASELLTRIRATAVHSNNGTGSKPRKTRAK